MPESSLREIDAILSRLYSQRRSAFVHAAAMKRFERQEDDVFVSLLPDPKTGTAAPFQYHDDEIALRELTRSVGSGMASARTGSRGNRRGDSGFRLAAIAHSLACFRRRAQGR